MIMVVEVFDGKHTLVKTLDLSIISISDWDAYYKSMTKNGYTVNVKEYRSVI